MEHHILVVFPHPDDEAFGTAGVIAQHIQKGRPVTYACGTLGEMGRNMGSPLFANRETLPEIRKKELKDACDAIGLRDLRMLGLRDKTIEFEDPEKLADRIEKLIEEIQPSLVITHYPGFAVHPDHNALGEATVRAVGRIPGDKRPELYCHAFSKDTKEVLGEPDIVIDVNDVLDKKVAALKAHRSQMEVMISELDKKVEDQDPQMIEWLSRETFWYYKE
jgi:bacillithiol biosynthesis deacetylase BshB2